MTIFESAVRIAKPVNQVYLYLADMNNHEQLLKGDDISDWSSTSTEAKFTIRNMIKLALKIDGLIKNEQVRIIPVEKPPFNLEIKWLLTAEGDQTNVQLTIAADLNMMMKMVAAGPLQKLADDETTNLSALLN